MDAYYDSSMPIIRHDNSHDNRCIIMTIIMHDNRHDNSHDNSCKSIHNYSSILVNVNKTENVQTAGKTWFNILVIISSQIYSIWMLVHNWYVHICVINQCVRLWTRNNSKYCWLLCVLNARCAASRFARFAFGVC